MPHTTGQILNNRYRIVNLLGQGGFGAVYRAWDVSLSRPCAVKENLDATQKAQIQFTREARMLANLSHTNMPRVTDYFSIPEQGQYLVMDFVEGEDLQERLDHSHGPLPEAQVLPWISQVCDALTYLHAQNPPIIHRDIKPANIKITPQGQAMLVDFGIAKVYDPHLKTTIGARAVTPGYSPLEQYGQGSTDARSDIYALGATLYSLLTGQVPSESPERMVHDTLLPAQQINQQVSPATSAVITQAMGIQPDQRFQSAAGFKSALLQDEVEAVVLPTQLAATIKPSTAQEVTKARTLPWGWIVAAITLSLLLVTVIIFITSRGLDFSSPGQDDIPVVAAIIDTPSQSPSAAPTRPPPTSTNTPTLEASATFTRSPTSTHRPTSTSAPTSTRKPLEPASLVLDRNSHCRGGPGTEYEILRDMTQGTTLEILGENNTAEWYLIGINDPSTRKKLCWLHAGNGHVTGDQTNIPVCTWFGDGYTADQKCSQP